MKHGRCWRGINKIELSEKYIRIVIVVVLTGETRWTNEQACEQCGIKVDVLGKIKRITSGWFGHME